MDKGLHPFSDTRCIPLEYFQTELLDPIKLPKLFHCGDYSGTMVQIVTWAVIHFLPYTRFAALNA